jgi:hypothetical protein
MERPAEYQTPAIDSFDESEILGDAPEATGTHGLSGSQIYTNGA